MTMTDSPQLVAIHYSMRSVADAWALPEVPVPESHAHDLLVRYLTALLEAWVRRTSLDAVVTCNLALRWSEGKPSVGIDPDVMLVTPAPPDPVHLSSLCTWKPGHVPPRLAIEVVSKNHPYKDYRELHERYAASGVGELWVLDPELHGPTALGGPVPIQQWMRRENGFQRMHFGDGPIYSESVDAWLWADPIRLTEDAGGTRPWLTGEEAERSAREAAEARIAELERQLAAKK